MNFAIGLVLVLALSFFPAPEQPKSNVDGEIRVQTGTEGTHLGWTIKSNTQPNVTIEMETRNIGE